MQQLLNEIINLPQLNRIIEDCDLFTRNRIEGFINHYLNLATHYFDSESALKSNVFLGNSKGKKNYMSEKLRAGFWEWDLSNDEIYYGDNFYRILGFSPGDFPAKFKSWLELIHPDDREYTVNKIFEYIIRKNYSYMSEFRMKAKNGTWKWILCKAKLLDGDSDNSRMHLVGINLDITSMLESASAQRSSFFRFGAGDISRLRIH